MCRIFYALILVGLFLGTTGNLFEPAQAESKSREASGQKYIKVPVKRKPADKDWKLRDTRTIELLEGFQPGSKNIPYSKYGGRIDKKTEAKGYFYPKKVPAVKVCAKAGIGRKQSIKSHVIVEIFYKITSKTEILDSSR